jgi:hypothetical protein
MTLYPASALDPGRAERMRARRWSPNKVDLANHCRPLLIYHNFPPMPASSSGRSSGKPSMGALPNDNLRVEPASSSSQPNSASTSRLEAVSRNLFAPFHHRKRDSHKILADRTLSFPACLYSPFLHQANLRREKKSPQS